MPGKSSTAYRRQEVKDSQECARTKLLNAAKREIEPITQKPSKVTFKLKQYECAKCNKRLSSKQALVSHITTQHNQSVISEDTIEAFKPFFDIIKDQGNAEELMESFRNNVATFLSYLLLLNAEPLFQKVHQSMLHFLALGHESDSSCLSAVQKHRTKLNQLVLQLQKQNDDQEMNTDQRADQRPQEIPKQEVHFPKQEVHFPNDKQEPMQKDEKAASV